MSTGNYQEINSTIFSNLQNKAIDMGLQQTYLPESHQLEFSENNDWLLKVSLPWSMEFSRTEGLLKREDYHLALVMIRAGIACTGHFHDGEMVNHKVFRAYMVRQKQGKSQIKYLKTKGKSRAGSRIRLGESEQFFMDINERLRSYSDQYPITHWGISCSKTLWPYFFGANPTPPFEKKQENLMSIPFHVQQPDFETLQEIHRKLNNFQLLFSEIGRRKLGSIEQMAKSQQEDQDLEDW